MSAIKDGGPAFPVSTTASPEGGYGHQDGHFTWQFGGMTLRDYFAAKALTGLLAEPISEGSAPSAIHCTPGFDNTCFQPGDRLATAAYALADAMLRAREA